MVDVLKLDASHLVIVCVLSDTTTKINFSDKNLVTNINFVIFYILVVTKFLFVTIINHNSDKTKKNITKTILKNLLNKIIINI